jgi:pimeloyl-ACP methyl ester carboxylesterase
MTRSATTRTITTRRGITCQVLVMGDPDAPPLVSFHGFSGHLAAEPTLQLLAEQFSVHAPVWPGYGDEPGEELIEDMSDFALHGADVVDALGLGPAHGGPPPHLLGHSMGAMIAAEMAAMSPHSYGRLVLLAPLGLWLADHPIGDVFSMLPYEFPQQLFHDPLSGATAMTGGLDFDDPEAIKAFLIANSRRLGTAGKILFPIPNRRLAKRLYRVVNPALVVWGESDRLVPPIYGREWVRLLPHGRVAYVEAAGHMLPYERPGEVATLVTDFLA